jgi:lipoprotein-anchoring transpeptidase ErfK/SrfK
MSLKNLFYSMKFLRSLICLIFLSQSFLSFDSLAAEVFSPEENNSQMMQDLNELLADMLSHSKPIPQSEMTDEMALEEGWTPFEEFNNQQKSLQVPFQFNLENLIKFNRLVIVVNKSAKGPGAQTLKMYERGQLILDTKVSTGKEEKVKAKSGRIYVSTTPIGHFRPTNIYRDYMSYTWKAPMPNAVFYIGGIAIHATGESNYKLLGQRASGGCVRTTLKDSLLIRQKVMESGKGFKAGDFVLRRESAGRTIIDGNRISVNQINRMSGELLNAKTSSWDTAIVVHEN